MNNLRIRTAALAVAALLSQACGPEESLADVVMAAGASNAVEAMTEAATEGNAEMVKRLIDAGADVESEMYGVTALIRAATRGYEDVAKVLVDAGANVDVKAEYDTTALMSAAYSGHADVVKVLIDAGADVNAKNSDGVTALMIAAEDHENVAKLLREAGARE